MKKSFFLLPLLLAAALLLSACGASVPDATQSLTESMLSALSDDDFAAAAELLDSESGLAETTIRSYIYALEAETDCDFSNGARVEAIPHTRIIPTNHRLRSSARCISSGRILRWAPCPLL